MEFKAVRNHTMEGENKKDGARMFLNQYLFQCPDIMRTSILNMCEGQRFVQLKKEMGFWKKRKCHVVLDKGLEYFTMFHLSRETVTPTSIILSHNIINITFGTMFGVANCPAEYQGLKMISIICQTEHRHSHIPKSNVIYLTPDLSCVQIRDTVTFTETVDKKVFTKGGEVIAFDSHCPRNVLVRMDGTNDFLSMPAPTLNRKQESSKACKQLASKIVWDWYDGIVKLKSLIEKSMGDTFDVKVPTFAAVNDRREWHKQILIVGNQFARGFIGPTLADCKVILDCYVRFSTDLTQMLVAQMSYLEKEAPALIIDDMLLETTKSDRKAPSSPSKSRSDAGLFQMEKEKANKNRETLALLHAGKAMYEENRIRESVAKNMTKKQRFSSMRPNLINRGLQGGPSDRTGFAIRGSCSKIRCFDVVNLKKILTDENCPAFGGCSYSVGLKFGGKKATTISFECSSRKEFDFWHRQFRYLKELMGGITMPVNVRAGFRMQEDHKWQGSFEKHFEFFCPSFHKMKLAAAPPAKPGNSMAASAERAQRCCHLCSSIHTKEMFFQVCPTCGFEMCTKCAKDASKIGEGGFSVVHLAINKHMVEKPPCVIKIFKNMRNTKMKNMMMETDLLPRIQAHPNIVKYQGYGGPNENGQLWLVMEYCDGGSVLDLRKNMTTLMAESHIAYILHCVLRALVYLHSKQIAHKDIKAANILLTKSGFVKLSDFGISEEVKGADTENFAFAGSPLWMPPEAYEGKQVNEKGDLWSLGITAIELAEGNPPFKGKPLPRLAYAVRKGPAPTLKPKNTLDKPPRRGDYTEWSDRFKRFISKCFAKDPKNRPSACRLLDDSYMNEEQFKLTTFCNRLRDVMQEAGIFEIRNTKRVEVQGPQGTRRYPALICRKSLVYLIQNKRYKDVLAPDSDKSDTNNHAKDIETNSIRHRLFAGGKMMQQKELNSRRDRKPEDLTEWGFMKTLQNTLQNTQPIDVPAQANGGPTQPNGAPTPGGVQGAKHPAVHVPGWKLPQPGPSMRRPTKRGGSKSKGSSGFTGSDGLVIPKINVGKLTMRPTSSRPILPIQESMTASNPTIPNLKLLDLQGNDLTASVEVEDNKYEDSKQAPSTVQKRLREHIKSLDPQNLLDKNQERSYKIEAKDSKLSYISREFRTDNEGNVAFRDKREEKKILYKRTDLVHIQRIGKGASGYVVKSFHLTTKRILALKHMSVDSAEQRHQLDKELIAFVKVQHPQIVTLEGAYYENGCIVIVLEYMDQGSLLDVIEKHKTIPEKYISQIAKQAIAGVAHIHSRRFIHRDIKPDNFLVNSFGEVKVADFGLMRELPEREDGLTDKKGTIVYLSPERIGAGEGTKFSFPTDIWAIGLSLIYCAIGKLPTQTSNFFELVNALENEAAPSLWEYKKFSKDFCDFIDKCMIKDPKERWTARALLDHPFIRNSSTKAELADFLSTHDSKEHRARARHEIALLAREVRNNRSPAYSEILLESKYHTLIAKQLHVSESFVSNTSREEWFKSGKEKSNRKTYEFMPRKK